MRKTTQLGGENKPLKTSRSPGGVSAALETVARVLEPLSPHARARVLKAAAVLLDIDLEAEPAEEEEAEPETAEKPAT